MFLKISIFIFIIKILQSSSQGIINNNQSSNEVIATCIYHFAHQNIQYSCLLENATITSPEQILIITGSHLPNRTDGDVLAVFTERGTRFDYFNGEVFQKFRNLQILTLGTVRGIGQNAFNLCLQLQVIQFSATMQTLPNGLFRNCQNLRVFNLISTHVRSLPADLFRTIQSLERFTIMYSRITTLPSTIFQHSINLNFVNLQFNLLENLDPMLFSNVRNLETILLDNNRISDQSVIVNLLINHRNLRNIRLHRSGIPSIDLNFFK